MAKIGYMSTTIILPTTKRPPSRQWIEQKILMLGPGGIGKSEFWAQGEKTLFLECELGLSELSVLKIPCRDWEDIKESYLQLYMAAQAIGWDASKPDYEVAKQFPYDTLVIDTIDRFVSFATEETIARAKLKYKKDISDAINSLGDIPNGSGWFSQTELIGNSLRKFEGLPCAVVLIGHLKKEIIEETTRKIPYTTITIGGQTGTNLLYWSDTTMHIQSRMVGDEARRQVRTRPTENIEAKAKNKLIPDPIVWGKDAAANYTEFRKLFN